MGKTHNEQPGPPPGRILVWTSSPTSDRPSGQSKRRHLGLGIADQRAEEGVASKSLIDNALGIA